jgi:hypothetical protein
MVQVKKSTAVDALRSAGAVPAKPNRSATHHIKLPVSKPNNVNIVAFAVAQQPSCRSIQYEPLLTTSKDSFVSFVLRLLRLSVVLFFVCCSLVLRLFFRDLLSNVRNA